MTCLLEHRSLFSVTLELSAESSERETGEGRERERETEIVSREEHCLVCCREFLPFEDENLLLGLHY